MKKLYILLLFTIFLISSDIALAKLQLANNLQNIPQQSNSSSNISIAGDSTTLKSNIQDTSGKIKDYGLKLYVLGRTSETMTLKWNNSSDYDLLITARDNKSEQYDPQDGVLYSANPEFRRGSEIGSGNYVVFYGDSTQVSISQLMDNKVYRFSVYKVSKDGNLIYNTEEASFISQRTLRRGCYIKKGGYISESSIPSISSISTSSITFYKIAGIIYFEMEVRKSVRLCAELMGDDNELIEVLAEGTIYEIGNYIIALDIQHLNLPELVYYVVLTNDLNEEREQTCLHFSTVK